MLGAEGGAEIGWDWSPGRSDISWPLVYLGQAGWPGTSGLPVATNAPQYLIICCESSSWAGVSRSYSE